MYLLIPGRHHLLTNFQFSYIYSILQKGLKDTKDINGNTLNIEKPINGIIFAVTSANHSNTRRNPIPVYQRVMALQDFSREFDTKTYIFPINDVGSIDDFASYTLKTIEILSDDTIELTPKNCVVVCSTPVYKMYEKLGFKILPAELKDKNSMEYIAKLPFEIVETVGNSKEDWRKNDIFLKYTHPATIRMWALYNIGEKVKTLFGDKIVGDDGDLTETRDYNSYVRQMDEIAQLKFDDTKPFIKLGRIGDIGCAVGSWIKLCCEEPLFFESDFYGVEVARKLYDICNQRKDNGDFANPNVFFVKKNAVAGLAFEKNSMNTIHTSSLTHEIESYAGHESLLKFIKNRYDELSFGGVWINRDVVGPDNKEDLIFMELSKDDGLNDNFDKDFNDRNELKEYLDKMSSYTRFFRFVKDFRKETNYKIEYQLQTIDDKELINLKLKDAMEFITKKDYTDNWNSEMHETFCFWSFLDWKKSLEKVGFKVNPLSKSFSNDWIVKNRFENKVTFYKLNKNTLEKIEYPVTTMIMIAVKN